MGTKTIDYRDYYFLERYLEETVRHRFQQNGFLLAFDFFCIVIWKANRAKSKIAAKLLDKDNPKSNDLDHAAKTLTKGIAEAPLPRERMRILMEEWKFGLPMASAILTVLYPDKFTIYDVRVAQSIDEQRDDNQGKFKQLINLTSFKSIWEGYQKFTKEVQGYVAEGVKLRSLREQDRYLWGKSFHDQLVDDAHRQFGVNAK
jgi:hypothetical protein